MIIKQISFYVSILIIIIYIYIYIYYLLLSFFHVNASKVTIPLEILRWRAYAISSLQDLRDRNTIAQMCLFNLETRES